MNKLLSVAAAAEIMIGVALMINPSLVAKLLLGDAISGVSLAQGRVAGIGLLSLGVACWPRTANEGRSSSLQGLLCYNLLAMIYLLYLAIGGVSVGVLLWPTVVFHGILTSMLGRVWLKKR